ncbi:MAG: hypothetical protein JW810_06840 [Sedimentisphaerales bacterium]|nr:hypothetical protein [Sedimentisphaerales bacterium]
MNWGGDGTELIDCRFLGNRSGRGGGYQEYSGSSTLVNCLLGGNQAASCNYGGGGGVLANYGDIYLTNCTLVGNTALGTFVTGRGAGIYVDNGTAQVTNCLIWDNRDQRGIDASAQIDVGTGSADVQYSCVRGWGGIETNIGEDPRLVDATGADQIYGTPDDNCRLGPASSCLDAGDSGAVPATVTTDLDGQNRFQNGRVDIGAFEGVDQDIYANTDRLTIPEGTSQSFVVMLARDPGRSVLVHVAVVAGDPDIQITSTDTLVFDSLNYQFGQEVTVTALADEDALQHTATIQLTADGFRPAGLSVQEQEPLPGSVLYVDQSATGANSGAGWADAFTDLQDAIAYARTHAEITAIYVAQGVYRPAEPLAGRRHDAFELLPGVSLLGGFPPGGGSLEQCRPDEFATVLSGDLQGNDLPVAAAQDLFTEPTRSENSLHVVSGFLSDEGSLLDGFTIRGANSNPEYSSYDDGGGVHLDRGCRATIRQCHFEDNSSYCGGGLCGAALLEACTFRRNAAAWGGGGAALVESMRDCLVEQNYSSNRGGGIYIQTQDSTVTDCLIRQNTAVQEGGGICLDVSTQRPQVVGCSLIQNQADQGGGAASIGCTCGAFPVYVNCRFLGNSAAEGGGLYSEGEIDNTLNGCVFVGNSAETNGGAICDGYYSASDLFNCTIGYNNAAKGPAGGIYARDEGESYIYNSILWGNTAKDAPDGSATAQIDGARSTTHYYYSCIEGWTGSENGNHGLNPQFLDADGPDNLFGTEDDNVRLAPASPCIDTASNDFVGEDLADLDSDGQTSEPIPFDLDGRDRIDNDIVDMGAYERPSPGILYVDDSATGANNGTSWTDAWENLQDALAAAGAGDTIRVAQGTYRPDLGAGLAAGDPLATFTLINGVSLEGGYAGDGQADPNARDIQAYETILSGYLGGPKSYHVVTGSGVDASAVLDGFTIRDGDGLQGGLQLSGGGMYNQSGSPTVRHCRFLNNHAHFGGGMYNGNGSSPLVANCLFEEGGIGNALSSPEIFNCTFTHMVYDAIESYGGELTITNCVFRNNYRGLFIDYCDPVITNCTFSGNETVIEYDGGSQASLYNCIVWDNDESLYVETAYHCCLEGTWSQGSGNIVKNPQFADAELHLLPVSPCVNAGANAYLPADAADLDSDGQTAEPIPFDRDGQPRIRNGVVDMGAYECGLLAEIYVDAGAAGNNDGTCWQDAFVRLQDALDAASYGARIRVAQGTYRPDRDADHPGGSGDRNAAFPLVSGAALYGGYPAGGGTDQQRDPLLYETILSGDLNGDDGPGLAQTDENAYHVLVAGETDPATRVDGLTIAGGNADGPAPSNAHYGGGLYCASYELSRATLVGCRFRDNQAVYGGGIHGGMLRLENCIFLGNAADSAGGGWDRPRGWAYLINCLFSGNETGGSGGAIFCPNVLIVLINCTVSGNVAEGEDYYRGGGICGDDDTYMNLTNCIFWGNRDADGMIESSQIWQDYIAQTQVDYCCVQGWTGILGGLGNHGDNPRFIDADGADDVASTEDDNLRLGPDSACRDAGDNGAVPTEITTDLEGNDRIRNGIVDMGAYEAFPAAKYDIVDLGTLGGEYSVAWSINDQGQIVGWSQRADGQYHAARFDFQAPQNNADLGTLGGNWSEAVSINNQGYGVGQARTDQTGYVYHAALFDPAGPGGNIDLGGLGGDAGWACSINDSNQIVGAATLADGSWRATRFDAGGAGTNVNLGILDTPWGSDDSCALSINNLGQIVGYGRFSYEGTNIERAVRFDPSGGGENVNLTPGTDGGQARCINDAGQIVGTSHACQGACLFDPSGGGANLALGGLVDGQGSLAYAINNRGQIVGTAGQLDPEGEPVARAVLFDPSGQGNNIDLNSLIQPDLGWVLKAAYDINESGWIVGYGQNPQGISHRAFLLIPRIGSAGLIAHWKLDESEGTTAADSAGPHDGTLVNGPVWQPQLGALAFDGDDDYVDCGNDPAFDLTDAISVAAWVNIRQVDKDWQAVVTKGDSAWRLSTAQQTQRFHFAVTGAPYQYVSGSIEVPLDEWHHVCGTYDGASIRLYIDGVEDSAGPVAYAGGITTNSYPVYIGENAEETDRHWNGSLDDVRVYNYALTPGEVAELAFRPTIHYVDAAAAADGDGRSWPTAYRHLQDAQAAARRGDQIRVAQGTYRPDRDADHPDGGGGRDATFQLISGVALYGGFPTGGGAWAQRDHNTYVTILSGDLSGNDTGEIDDPSRGENCYHVVRASHTDATTILDGFTITGGNAADGSASGDNCRGGGMYNEYADPQVIRCTFVRNSCGDNSGLGGGGMCNRYSHPRIVQCTFIDNHYIGADDDGGGGLCNSHSDPVLRDCAFVANTSGGSGGGMLNTQSTPRLTNCTFRDNRSTHYGGGLCNRTSDPVLSRCRILRNRSYRGGGGISNEDWSRPILLDCVISGNSVSYEYSAGGGISNQFNDEPLLVNCLLTGNTARQGGGLYSYYGTTTLRNCTLHGNRADQGQAIYLRTSDATLTDSIVWGDNPPAADAIYAEYYLEAKALTIRYSDIQAGRAGVTVEAGNILHWGPGNIEADPLFVKGGYWQDTARAGTAEEATWLDGDYHLQSQGWRWDDQQQKWTFDRFSSRCIDAGNPGAPTAAEPLTLPVDPDNLWGVNRRLNLGAYGGADQASMPPQGWSLLADLTNDGTVNLEDYSLQAADWLTTAPALPGDLDRDGTPACPDLQLLGFDWLKHTAWHAPEP